MKFDGAAFKNTEGLNVGILKFFPIRNAVLEFIKKLMLLRNLKF